jgi:hypothetical protein
MEELLCRIYEEKCKIIDLKQTYDVSATEIIEYSIRSRQILFDPRDNTSIPKIICNNLVNCKKDQTIQFVYEFISICKDMLNEKMLISILFNMYCDNISVMSSDQIRYNMKISINKQIHGLYIDDIYYYIPKNTSSIMVYKYGTHLNYNEYMEKAMVENINHWCREWNTYSLLKFH